jgi:hypothetical protein
MSTFRHLIANSTFIMPTGKVCVFAGAAGGHGIYTTTDEDEVKELRKLAVQPTVQISELKEVPVPAEPNKVTVDLEQPAKPADPSLAAAVADAGNSAVIAANPAVSATTADLGKIIAAAKAGK